MLVAVFTTFAASRKEPLGEAVERVHAAFIGAGFGEPAIHFTLTDPPVSAQIDVAQEIARGKRVSSIARVLKRWPQLERFARVTGSAERGSRKGRVMSNLTETGAVEPIDFVILREIALGIPKSFPCHGIRLHFSAPRFSDGPELPASPDPRTLSQLMRAGVDIGAGHPTESGVSIKDSWWVNGRQRSMAALRIVEADPLANNLPAPPADVVAVFAACGKVRKTLQLPLVMAPAETQHARREPGGVAPIESGEAIRAVVRAYRAKMPELLETLPHDLPHQIEDLSSSLTTAAGIQASGPKKPDLVRAFSSMGYDCRGESGAFTLKRRTGGNLTVRLEIEVGTWVNAVTASMKVIGLVNGQGFKATLSLPVSRGAVRGVVQGTEIAGQFPIGGADRWRQIVDNLAALVGELDRTFVPEIEAIAGPSPEWFRPETT